MPHSTEKCHICYFLEYKGSWLELVVGGNFYQLQLFPKFKYIPQDQNLSRPWKTKSHVNVTFSRVWSFMLLLLVATVSRYGLMQESWTYIHVVLSTYTMIEMAKISLGCGGVYLLCIHIFVTWTPRYSWKKLTLLKMVFPTQFKIFILCFHQFTYFEWNIIYNVHVRWTQTMLSYPWAFLDKYDIIHIYLTPSDFQRKVMDEQHDQTFHKRFNSKMGIPNWTQQ